MRLDRIEGHTFIADRLDGGSVVVDLGMNRGGFATAIVAGYGCSIVGAEPIADLHAGIPGHPRIVAERVAVAGQTGEITIGVDPGSDASVLSETDRRAVPAVSLEDFLDRNDVRRVDLLKVDIEGAELPMFRSVPDGVLRQVRQMTVEFHDFLEPALADDVAEVRARLDRHFWSMNFSRDNSDVLFVNRREPVSVVERLQLLGEKWYRGGTRVLRRTAGSVLPQAPSRSR